jgi:hypothetical protein
MRWTPSAASIYLLSQVRREMRRVTADPRLIQGMECDLTEMLGAKLAIERDGLQEIIDGLARRGYRVIGPTVRDGAISRAAGDIGSSAAPMRRFLAMLLDRIPGSAFCTRRSSGSGRHAAKVTVSRSSKGLRRQSRSPLLACVPASSARSRSRTGFFSRGHTSTVRTKFGVTVPSSWPSIAASRAPRASASPWTRDRRSKRVSTSL